MGVAGGGFALLWPLFFTHFREHRVNHLNSYKGEDVEGLMASVVCPRNELDNPYKRSYILRSSKKNMMTMQMQ
jgi:hypothetical protein